MSNANDVLTLVGQSTTGSTLDVLRQLGDTLRNEELSGNTFKDIFATLPVASCLIPEDHRNIVLVKWNQSITQAWLSKGANVKQRLIYHGFAYPRPDKDDLPKHKLWSIFGTNVGTAKFKKEISLATSPVSGDGTVAETETIMYDGGQHTTPLPNHDHFQILYDDDVNKMVIGLIAQGFGKGPLNEDDFAEIQDNFKLKDWRIKATRLAHTQQPNSAYMYMWPLPKIPTDLSMCPPIRPVTFTPEITIPESEGVCGI